MGFNDGRNSGCVRELVINSEKRTRSPRLMEI